MNIKRDPPKETHEYEKRPMNIKSEPLKESGKDVGIPTHIRVFCENIYMVCRFLFMFMKTFTRK